MGSSPLLCTVTRVSPQPPLHPQQLHGRPRRSEVGALRHLLLWTPEPGRFLQAPPPSLQHCKAWPRGRQVSDRFTASWFLFSEGLTWCWSSVPVGLRTIGPVNQSWTVVILDWYFSLDYQLKSTRYQHVMHNTWYFLRHFYRLECQKKLDNVKLLIQRQIVRTGCIAT